VINDLDLAGRSIGLQPIDEFPAFSFVLGDLHPHVLALPFGLAVLALAYELMLAGHRARREGGADMWRTVLRGDPRRAGYSSAVWHS
jgi:uncharacterized membrane protein